MINIKKEGILLKKTDQSFELNGVLNPAVIQEGEFIHLFYRAVAEGNHSSIGYSKLSGPLTVIERLQQPMLSPQYEFESHGLEDPRIVKLEDTFYLSYTAYDGVNALGAIATSTDLVHFKKRGLLVPQITYKEFEHLASQNCTMCEKYQRYNGNNSGDIKDGIKMYVWDKNVVFFPERINGLIYFMHRIKPDIQIAFVANLEDLTPEYWQNYFQYFSDYILMTAKYDHEVSYIGGGCPPIRTYAGWLIIYHGVRDSIEGYVYSACAALLDLNDPQIEIGRLPYPLFEPDLPWELLGVVNDVCFPTGAIVHDEILYIYYGAADENIACASMNLQLLIDELLINNI